MTTELLRALASPLWLLPSFKSIAVQLIGLTLTIPAAGYGGERARSTREEKLDQIDKYIERMNGFSTDGSWSDAISAGELALDLICAVWGEDHWKAKGIRVEIQSLTRLRDAGFLGQLRLSYATAQIQNARKLQTTGELKAALEHLKSGVDTFKAVLGETDTEYLGHASTLARLYESLQSYDDAESLFSHIAEIKERSLGDDHPSYGGSLNSLAVFYGNTGSLLKAQSLYEKALAIEQAANGKMTRNYATGAQNLGNLYGELGKYEKAEAALLTAVNIHEHISGKDSLNYVESLSRLGINYVDLCKYSDAEHAFLEVLDLREKILGKKGRQYAITLSNLGELYRLMGDSERSANFHKLAIPIIKNAAGDDHADYAACIRKLGLLYLSQDRHADAMRLLERAASIEGSIKHSDATSAITLNALASLHESTGNYVEAERLYRRALKIIESAKGTDVEMYAATLHNLGDVYSATGHPLSMAIHFHAMELRKKIFGEGHSKYAISLYKVAKAYEQIASFTGHETVAEKAEPLYKEAIRIFSTTVGTNHPNYATAIAGLGTYYLHRSDYRNAESFLKQAQQVRTAANDPAYAGTSSDGTALGYVYLAQQRYAQAASVLDHDLETKHHQLIASQGFLSERQLLARARSLRAALDAYLSIPPEARSCPRSYQIVLAWKGAVFAHQRLNRLRRAEPTLEPLFSELEQATRRLAQAGMAAADFSHFDVFSWRQQLAQLAEDREQIERRIAQQSREFQRERERQQTTSDMIASCLPEHTALIDFVEFSPFTINENTSKLQRKGGHLLAYVVRPDRPIVEVDLGPVDRISLLLEQWRTAISRGKGGVQEKDDSPNNAQFRLRSLIWEPLAPHLKDTHMVFVSPDGALASCPFCALPATQRGKYLIEELGIGIIPVPQLIPKVFEEQAQPAANNVPVSILVLGDVDYDADLHAEKSASQSVDSNSRHAVRGDDELVFLPLHATRTEMVIVESKFQETHKSGLVHAYDRSMASEAIFRELAPQCRYIHIATHGFFAPPKLRSALESPLYQGIEKWFGSATKSSTDWHPGLLSGLALAGANRVPDSTVSGTLIDDGVLTSLELAENDLSHTDLIVMSACETGLGRIAAGEGVLGLQRAAQVAGARTTITSLWKVNDEITQQLMEQFYSNLWERKMNSMDALRSAQLHILRNGPADSTQPRYWAAWVLSGAAGEMQKVSSISLETNGPRLPRSSQRKRNDVPYWPTITIGALAILLLILLLIHRFWKSANTDG